MFSFMGSCTFCSLLQFRNVIMQLVFSFLKSEYFLVTKSGVPVPLATKMYYSQRNHRLRSAISHLYFAASNEGHCSDMVSPKVLQGNMVPQASSPKNFSHEQMDNQPEKKVCHSSFSEWSNIPVFVMWPVLNI